MSERPGAWVPARYAARFRPDPQQPTAVLVECDDIVIWQTGGIRRLIAKSAEFIGTTIEQRQAAGCSDPQSAVVVFQ